MVQGPEPLYDNKEVLIRFFLTSSRSLKDSLAVNDTLQADVKDLVMEIPMPKFAWVAEISDKILIKQGKANGLILLDATEANIYYNKPRIFAAYQDKLIKFDQSNGKLENNSLTLQPFNIYTHNLRNF